MSVASPRAAGVPPADGETAGSTWHGLFPPIARGRRKAPPTSPATNLWNTGWKPVPEHWRLGD
ncbi:MAG: hypothetical protein LBK99_22270 [Opitutaceae bacterium]|nr:hypothetical protein [Opitutaceae bacterium]